jgi:amino acid transporter
MISALLIAIVCVIIGIVLAFNAFATAVFLTREENIEEFMGDFCNPIKIHKSERVNWIGTILQTILAHIVAIIPCFCYWVWKLCTFGAEED